jgi:hypothetical protein
MGNVLIFVVQVLSAYRNRQFCCRGQSVETRRLTRLHLPARYASCSIPTNLSALLITALNGNKRKYDNKAYNPVVPHDHGRRTGAQKQYCNFIIATWILPIPPIDLEKECFYLVTQQEVEK